MLTTLCGQQINRYEAHRYVTFSVLFYYIQHTERHRMWEISLSNFDQETGQNT